MALLDLLERGYFPKELPNPFNTSSFARCVTMHGVTLPASYLINPSTNRSMKKTKGCKYSHARGGLLRRQLTIQNPISQYILSKEIDANWNILLPHIGGTLLSATNPIQFPTGRAINSASSQGDRKTKAVITRLNNKFILKTDISRFYHSIYTHSIPWAIHTKLHAKRHRQALHIGNWLDIIIRNGQDGQTVGIPIGPDTSLVIAEILMQVCDKDLISKLPGLQGHRFIDDYELGFQSRTEAEDAYHILESVLSAYELALNPKKTEIVELPTSLEAAWARPIRNAVIRSTGRQQEVDLYDYFDTVFNLKQSYPNESILQFAVARLRSINLDPQNWELFQRFILNCASQEPATLPYALEQIIQRVNSGAPRPISETNEVLNTIVEAHSGLIHSSEVAWALWGCLALQIPLSTAAIGAVSMCEDSVVALLALHCETAGLTHVPLNKSLWSTYMTTDNLYDDQWLLCYEANVKGWLPTVGGGDHVSADPNFAMLKANGVNFYDLGQAVPNATMAPLPVLTNQSSTEDLDSSISG